MTSGAIPDARRCLTITSRSGAACRRASTACAGPPSRPPARTWRAAPGCPPAAAPSPRRLPASPPARAAACAWCSLFLPVRTSSASLLPILLSHAPRVNHPRFSLNRVNSLNRGHLRPPKVHSRTVAAPGGEIRPGTPGSRPTRSRQQHLMQRRRNAGAPASQPQGPTSYGSQVGQPSAPGPRPARPPSPSREGVREKCESVCRRKMITETVSCRRALCALDNLAFGAGT
jgi:hypothetical protein